MRGERRLASYQGRSSATVAWPPLMDPPAAGLLYALGTRKPEPLISPCGAVGPQPTPWPHPYTFSRSELPGKGIPEHREIKVEPRVGRKQIPVSVLRKAQKLIVDKLLTKFNTVRGLQPYL